MERRKSYNKTNGEIYRHGRNTLRTTPITSQTMQYKNGKNLIQKLLAAHQMKIGIVREKDDPTGMRGRRRTRSERARGGGDRSRKVKIGQVRSKKTRSNDRERGELLGYERDTMINACDYRESNIKRWDQGQTNSNHTRRFEAKEVAEKWKKVERNVARYMHRCRHPSM